MGVLAYNLPHLISDFYLKGDKRPLHKGEAGNGFLFSA
jgi:hypothetical protein